MNPYQDDKFWVEVKAESAARRAQPLPFATEALESLFADASDDEEALEAWRRKVSQFPWWAEDALYCIDAIQTVDEETLLEVARRARLPLRGQPARQWMQTRLEWLHRTFNEVVRAKGST